ncbi:hypothetical protein GEMRC1_006944 [Eukaryota sp. GEM-RC1]
MTSPPQKRSRTDNIPIQQRVTSVYVTNLPSDVTVDELVSFFSKAGVVRRNEETGEHLVRLYTKGDAKVTFLRPESVFLCIQLLDDTPLRPNTPNIHVEEASSEPKPKQSSSSDPKEPRPSRASTISARERRRRFKKQYQQALGWGDPTSTLPPGQRVVVLKNMFTLEEVEEELGLLSEINDEVLQEASKYGDVEKVTVYGENPEGVVTVRFKEGSSATQCEGVFDGRVYNGHLVKAYLWDGDEKFKKKKTIEEDDDIERFVNFETKD